MFNLTPVVRVLLVINVLVFLATNEAIINQFGLHSFLSDKFNPIQLLTHMFLHSGFGHIFGNMIGLVVFGPMLEQVWGPRRFTFFYFFCGIGAALLFSGINYWEMRDVYSAVVEYRTHPGYDSFSSFIDQYAGILYNDDNPKFIQFLNEYKQFPNNASLNQSSVLIVNQILSSQVDEPLIGASGAIFGIIMGFGLLFPNTQLFLLFPPIPVKAKYLVIFYGAVEVYSSIHQSQNDHVAHFAHIGGMLFAYILIKIWGSQRKTFY